MRLKDRHKKRVKQQLLSTYLADSENVSTVCVFFYFGHQPIKDMKRMRNWAENLEARHQMMHRSLYSPCKTSSQINYSEERRKCLKSKRRRGEGVHSARALSILKSLFAKKKHCKRQPKPVFLKEKIKIGSDFVQASGRAKLWRQRKWTLEVIFNKLSHLKMESDEEQPDRIYNMAVIGQEPERKQLLFLSFPVGNLISVGTAQIPWSQTSSPKVKEVSRWFETIYTQTLQSGHGH